MAWPRFWRFRLAPLQTYAADQENARSEFESHRSCLAPKQEPLETSGSFSPAHCNPRGSLSLHLSFACLLFVGQTASEPRRYLILRSSNKTSGTQRQLNGGKCAAYFTNPPGFFKE